MTAALVHIVVCQAFVSIHRPGNGCSGLRELSVSIPMQRSISLPAVLPVVQRSAQSAQRSLGSCLEKRQRRNSPKPRIRRGLELEFTNPYKTLNNLELV